METLTNIFFNEVDPNVRTRVLRALTRRRLIQKEWVNRGGGCLMAVAATEVLGTTLKRFDMNDDPTEVAARALGISKERVTAGYMAWDAMNNDQARAFVRRLKAELKNSRDLKQFQESQPKGIVQSVLMNLRQRISA